MKTDNRSIDQLNQALEAQRHGLPLPALDDETRRLLDIAKNLQAAAPSAMPNAARAAARRRILTKVQTYTPPVTLLEEVRRIIQNHLRRRLAVQVILVLVLLFSMTSAGVALASQGSLPGDSLYVVKETIENVQLDLSPDKTDANLYDQFLERRMAEIQKLIGEGRFADLEVALQRFETQQDAAVLLVEKLGQKQALAQAGSAPAVLVKTQKHIEVLTALLAQAPDSARLSLQHAIQASSKSRDKLQAIFGDGVPGYNPVKPPTAKPDKNPGNKSTQDHGNKPTENPGNKPDYTPGKDGK